MVEVKHSGKSMEERLRDRTRNSGDVAHADHVVTVDKGIRTNVHRSRVQQYGEDRLTDLPDEFEALVDRARTIFGREMDKARKALAVLTADKSSAQKAVTELQAQRKSAQAQLSSVQAYLDRGQTLAGLDQEIAGARKTLDGLKAEIAGATTAAAAAEKQQAEAEAQLTALRTEADDYRAERADTETYFDKARALANGWRTQ
jgi:chromosome segregation ATPase